MCVTSCSQRVNRSRCFLAKTQPSPYNTCRSWWKVRACSKKDFHRRFLLGEDSLDGPSPPAVQRSALTRDNLSMLGNVRDEASPSDRLDVERLRSMNDDRLSDSSDASFVSATNAFSVRLSFSFIVILLPPPPPLTSLLFVCFPYIA